MRLLDPSHPFFKPPWRRYLVVAAPFLWAFLEFSNGNTLWAYVFAGIGGVLAWNLVFAWKDNSDR